MNPDTVSYEITEAEYRTFSPKNGHEMDVLRIGLSNGEAAQVPNGGWTTDNEALCTMAYLGVSPSTLDEAVGESVPIMILEDGTHGVPMFVVNIGREALRTADWFAGADPYAES